MSLDHFGGATMMGKVNLALRGQNHAKKVDKIIEKELFVKLCIILRTLLKKFFLYVFMVECFDLLSKLFQNLKGIPLLGSLFYLIF